MLLFNSNFQYLICFAFNKAIEVYSYVIRNNKLIETLHSEVNYDPGYQVKMRLKQGVKIMPQDQIIIICAYNTTMASHMIDVNIVLKYNLKIDSQRGGRD